MMQEKNQKKEINNRLIIILFLSILILGKDYLESGEYRIRIENNEVKKIELNLDPENRPKFSGNNENRSNRRVYIW